jgi:hypothetical protein
MTDRSIADSKLITCHVDQGAAITSGYFQLSLNFAGLTTINPEV